MIAIGLVGWGPAVGAAIVDTSACYGKPKSRHIRTVFLMLTSQTSNPTNVSHERAFVGSLTHQASNPTLVYFLPSLAIKDPLSAPATPIARKHFVSCKH